jgi:nicotinamidase-related amidase
MAQNEDPLGIDWLPGRLVERMRARRGRLNAFDSLIARRTALVVIDLTILFAGDGPAAEPVVARINRLAEALRSAGGLVVWVRPSPAGYDALTEAVLGAGPAARYRAATDPGDPRAALHPGLTIGRDDLQAAKRGYSAFFPGASDLPERLAAAGIDTVLIAGAVSNVCCEASARDAFARGFRAVMLADANLGREDEHRAALAAIYRNFGDVRSVAEAIALLGASSGLGPRQGRERQGRDCAPAGDRGD